MHPVTYALRYADLASLRTRHSMLETYGVTPARFDVLFMLRERVPRKQGDVRATFGVTRQNVHRMTKAMAERGLIRRFKNGRSIWLELTDIGLAILRHARKHALRELERTIVKAICKRGDWLIGVFEDWERRLHRLERSFGGTSDGLYTYPHPDD